MFWRKVKNKESLAVLGPPVVSDTVSIQTVQSTEEQEEFHFAEGQLIPALPSGLERIPVEPIVTDGQFKKYQQVAEAIKFRPGALVEAELKNFLFQQRITIFPYDKVAAYLDGIFGPHRNEGARVEDTTWGWRPLRYNDSIGVNFPSTHRGNGFLLRDRYQYAVPLPVLLCVQQIEKAVPKICFVVSDAVTPHDKTDPFLGITAAGMNDILVVERWNEPSFRM